MSSYKDRWYPKGTLPEPFLPVIIDVFSANVTDLMPPAESIPDAFIEDRHNKWFEFIADKFFRGLESVEFDPKEGIDSDAAYKHAMAILGSWLPKHEYKEAAVAYLLSLWFEDVRWKAKK